MPDRKQDDHVEVYTDAQGEYRWRRIAMDNQIVSDSPVGFAKRSAAKDAAKAYNRDVGDIRDQTKTGAPTAK